MLIVKKHVENRRGLLQGVHIREQEQNCVGINRTSFQAFPFGSHNQQVRGCDLQQSWLHPCL